MLLGEKYPAIMVTICYISDGVLFCRIVECIPERIALIHPFLFFLCSSLELLLYFYDMLHIEFESYLFQ